MAHTSTVPQPFGGGWTKIFMAVAVVSTVLVLFEKGILAALIVVLCAVPFYYRSVIMQSLEPKFTSSVGGIFVPGLVTIFLTLPLTLGLTLGLFVNGFVKPGEASGLVFPVIGMALIAYVVWTFFWWAVEHVKAHELGGLTDEIRQNHAHATGWASTYDVLKRFNLPNGAFQPEHIKGIHIGNGIHWNEQGHILTVGGAGQGKGTCLVLPALLSDGLVRAGISVVCLDPKGENAAVSAPHLKRAGYDVHVINPFGLKEVAHLGNSRFNPFDLLEIGEDKKFCDMLAFSLHNRTSSGDGEFFNERCRQYISLYARYILHVKRDPEMLADQTPEFEYLYYSLRVSGEEREKLLAKMATNETFPGRLDAKAILNRLLSDAVKTEESIFSTIEKAINILDDEKLQASLSHSDFDLRNIAQKPTAIFVCVRHDELEYYSTWIRIFTDALLKTLNRYYNPSRKVLVLLDEFAQLGYIDQFAKAPAILRGYNVTLWPIVQNIGQLQDLYGREAFETFSGNTVVKQWFGGYGGAMDNTTADYIAKRMPNTLQIIESREGGPPRGKERPVLDFAGILNYNKIIGEVMRLPAPFEIEKVPYWQLKFAMNNASPNPFYKK